MAGSSYLLLRKLCCCLRCPLHRSKSKNFLSFSVSLGMQRLSRFFEFWPHGQLSRPASREAPLPPPMSSSSEQVEKISKFFRFLRDEKTLSFFRLLTHGGRAMPAPPQPTSPASISPPSEQVEKISKFFRFLTQHLCSASLCVYLHHRLVTCSFQPATACDPSGARDQSCHRRGGEEVAAAVSPGTCLQPVLGTCDAMHTSVSCLRWCDAKASAKPCMISRCEVVYQYFFRAGHGCCRRAPSSAARVQVIKQSAPDVMMYQWLAIKAGLFR